MDNKTYLFDRTAHQGRIELTGRDRLDLLHRMSTNDMNSLKVGEGCSTVLTTALARIIDRVVVYHRGDTALMIANYPDVVRGWLQKHIFFRDEIKLRDVSAELCQLELHGAQAAIIAETIAPGASQLALYSFSTTADHAMLVARTFSLNGDGFMIVAPMRQKESLQEQLLAHEQLEPGDEQRYEMLRIAAGLPGKGHELTEDYIPLEANLWESVSFSKGCYIGQEIIARMESRNRLAKTLVQVRIQGEAEIGAALSSDGRNMGTLTSVATLDDGTVIGLGFVKPDLASPGTVLTLQDTAHNGTTAEVIAK